MKEIPAIWYMRDNHTFLRLSEDYEVAIMQIKETFDEGNTYGMLCTNRKPDIGVVHAGDKNSWRKFAADAKRWFADRKRTDDNWNAQQSGSGI